MKKYVKLFEEFNPEEFIEDFGVDVFSIKLVQNIVDNIEFDKYANKEILRILKSGTYPTNYSKDIVIINSTSKYDMFSKIGLGANCESIVETYLRTCPKNERYLDISWTFRFWTTHIINPEHGHITISFSITAKATHPMIDKDFWVEFDYKYNITQDSLREAISKSIIRLGDRIVDYKISNGLDISNFNLLYDFGKSLKNSPKFVLPKYDLSSYKTKEK